MKISIEIEKDSEDGKDAPDHMAPEMPEKELTPFQRKVAQMLAKIAGRKTPNAKDLEMASELEEEEDK